MGKKNASRPEGKGTSRKDVYIRGRFASRGGAKITLGKKRSTVLGRNGMISQGAAANVSRGGV